MPIRRFARKPLDIVTLRGSRLELFHALGRSRGRQMAARALAWERRCVDELGRNRVRRIESEMLGSARNQAPEIVEEIAAMAEGAGTDFLALFRLNITELLYFTEKCTTVVKKAAGRKALIVGHNEDWDPLRNDVFVLRASMDGMSFMVLCYDGFLPGMSCGINSFGLCHAVNYLPSRARRGGIPRTFVTRRLVSAASVDEAIRWVRRASHTVGQSINLAKGESFVNMEIGPRGIAVRRPTLPYVHTNHYLSRRAPVSESSRTRLRRVRGLLDRDASAKDILFDTATHPYSVWRNAESEKDSAATLATVIMETDRREMTIWRDQKKSVRLSLK